MINEVPAKDVVEKMLIVCKSLRWKCDKPSDEFSHVYMKTQIEGYPSSHASLSYGRYPYEGRITVTAYSNHDSSIYRYGEKHLSITIGATRSAEQILKEIQRRFIPPYLEIARKAEEIQKKQDEYRRRLEVCMARLKGEPLEESEIQNGKIHLHIEDIWGIVQYGSDDQVSLDFHNVPAAKAEGVLTILRETTGSLKEESRSSDSERMAGHE